MPASDNLRVVLISPRNPLNIGAAARAMSNFGFFHLRLVNAYDVAFREAKSAVNAAPVLEAAQQYSTIGEAVADCALVVGTTSLGPRGLEHTLRPLERAGPIIRKQLGSVPVALLFGSEKFGLSNDDLAWCHWLLRIGTREEHRSMNLGQAVAVALYELARKPVVPRAEERRRPAQSEDVERITALLIETLEQSGYVHSGSTPAKLRRLVRRLNLETHDAEVWLGIFRQIQWKLKSGAG